MINRKSVFGALGSVAVGAMLASSAAAQDVTLKFHHLLPQQANVPRLVLEPWAAAVEAESGGSIDIEFYPAMSLGGAPPELMDQAVDGVAELVWTVVGYTPGRFPGTEVFELPFMVEDARAASCAYWKMYDEHMQEEFSDVHIIGTWVHGPGMFHTTDPVESPSDLEGMKIRGGSRLVNQLLTLTGAEPVGLPVPAVPESLSKGVIDGTTIPWEVTPALRVSELVENHTEFEGPGLYTLTFVLAMNNDAYAALSDEQKAAIDAFTGENFSVFAGGMQADADVPARAIAVENGNNIITVSAEDAAAEWAPVVDQIYADWVAEMNEKGIDGQARIDQARALMTGECAGADYVIE